MAYTPKNWQCGDVVTAEALNHIEQGIGGAHECCENSGALIVKITRTEPCPEGYSGLGTSYLDATWQQVKDAYDAGIPVYLQIEESDYSYRLNLISIDHGNVEIGYRATFYDGNTTQAISHSPTEELYIEGCQRTNG